MLHSLIKKAITNLEPEIDPVQNRLEDSCFITEEEIEDSEFIELEEEDEYEECDCVRQDADENIYTLETSIDELGFDLEFISDSEVLEDFFAGLLIQLGYTSIADHKIFYTSLKELDFIYFDHHLKGDITIEVNTEDLIEYMDN